MRRFLATIILAVFTFTALAADSKTGSPFNGKDLTGWKLKGNKEKSNWVVGQAKVFEDKPTLVAVAAASAPSDGELINQKNGGVDIYTEEKYGDCIIELEFMVPKGSNSGVYVMGEYEIQVFDSYGKEKIGMGDLGAIYSASTARVNAAKKPGEWQKFVIDFQAPKFDGDKRVAPAKFLKVTLNDVVIHENVEMKGPTPGGVTGKEHATGPLMFQGDHGPVAYRNIKITAK
jgi:hypothetical protein